QMFSVLQNNSGSVSAEALATNMVRAFGDRYGPGVTLSAVSTADLGSLATALQTFSTDVSNPNVTLFSNLQTLNTLAGETYFYSSESDQRDLGAFMQAVADDTSLPLLLRNDAGGVMTSLTAVVLAETEDLRGSSGLSIYLPVDNSDTAPQVDPGFLPT